MIELTMITQQGELVQKAIPVTNIIEVSQHPDDPDKSWVKHWVGNDVKNFVSTSRPKYIADAVRQAFKNRAGN